MRAASENRNDVSCDLLAVDSEFDVFSAVIDDLDFQLCAAENTRCARFLPVGWQAGTNLQTFIRATKSEDSLVVAPEPPTRRSRLP